MLLKLVYLLVVRQICSSWVQLEVATAERKLLRSGFPPGITVDELKLYRKKQPLVNFWPHDNLKLEQGSFKALKTEYRRRFKNFYDISFLESLRIRREEIFPIKSKKPDDSLVVEGSLQFHPEYNEKFIKFPLERSMPIKADSPLIPSINEKNEDEDRTSEDIKLMKRRTPGLKLEGEFYGNTEKADKFIEYLLTKRPDLIRRPTTLKLEGEMDIKTENREKYIPFAIQPRPPLCKKLTNLHLEGDLFIKTEKQEQFVQYDVQERPALIRALSNLHVEGEFDFLPEYTKEFVEFNVERSKLVLPLNNLKTDGFYDVSINNSSTPFRQRIHPQIPFLRSDVDSSPIVKSRISTRRNSLRLEGEMDTMTESRNQFVEKALVKTEKVKMDDNLLLEGKIDLNPEYRNAYIDYPKEGKAPTPTRHNRIPQSSALKNEGEMEINPEYSSSYVNFPRERPKLRKPECSLSSEGEMDHTTEQNAKFVVHPNVLRTTLKREPQLKLEGEFECQPEYRKAYIDYLIREKVERKARPLDNIGPTKRVVEEEPTEKTTITDLQVALPRDDKILLSKPVDDKKASKALSSKIEDSLFGPKLAVPSARNSTKSVSRNRSPINTASGTGRAKTLPRSRNLSHSELLAVAKQKRFDSPVRVKNLAVKSMPFLPTIDHFSKRNKWMRDSSVESSAFVVLDKGFNNT